MVIFSVPNANILIDIDKAAIQRGLTNIDTKGMTMYHCAHYFGTCRQSYSSSVVRRLSQAFSGRPSLQRSGTLALRQV